MSYISYVLKYLTHFFRHTCQSIILIIIIPNSLNVKIIKKMINMTIFSLYNNHKTRSNMRVYEIWIVQKSNRVTYFENVDFSEIYLTYKIETKIDGQDLLSSNIIKYRPPLLHFHDDDNHMMQSTCSRYNFCQILQLFPILWKVPDITLCW